MSEFGRLEAMAAGEEWQRRRKPFGPVPDRIVAGTGALSILCRASPIKRNRSTTLLMSQEALDAIVKEGEKIDGTVGGMAGMVVDYLARHGRFADVLKEAMAEHGAKS